MVAEATHTGNAGRYTGCLDRPTFASAEHWLRHYHRCLQADLRPWHPATADELRLADEHGLLVEYPQWIPGRENLRYLGLPSHFGRCVEPLPDGLQDRLLRTLAGSPDFRNAVAAVLGGAT